MRKVKYLIQIQMCFINFVEYYVIQINSKTGGDDGSVRFWDVRSPGVPIAARTNDHSHWIWSLRYNQFHDQLILTSSSDGQVVLSCMTSISSEPLGHLIDEDEDVIGKP